MPAHARRPREPDPEAAPDARSGRPERPEPAASCPSCCRSHRRCSPRAAVRPTRSTTGWCNRRPTAGASKSLSAVAAARVWTRTGRDITAKVPGVAAIAELGVECVLDGELVTGAGLPTDFYPLAGMLSARRRSQRLTFVAFDVLRLNGRSLLDYDLTSRREVLDCLVRLADGALTAVKVFPGVGTRRRLNRLRATQHGGCRRETPHFAVPAGPSHGRLAQGEMRGLAYRSRRATHQNVAADRPHGGYGMGGIGGGQVRMNLFHSPRFVPSGMTPNSTSMSRRSTGVKPWPSCTLLWLAP